MTAAESERQIVEYLREQGHTPPEIDRILDRLREYDRESTADSIFDSIASGDFDIASIVKDVLSDDQPGGET